MNERIELLRDLAEFARISKLLSEEQLKEFKCYIYQRDVQERQRADRAVRVVVQDEIGRQVRTSTTRLPGAPGNG